METTFILNRTIRSLFHSREIYGQSGDIVRLVADHGNVAIVQGKDGKKFPVAREYLNADPNILVKADEQVLIIREPLRKHKQKKALPQHQHSLF